MEHRKQAEKQGHETASLEAFSHDHSVLDALPILLAAISPSGVIRFQNHAWRSFQQQYPDLHLFRVSVGDNYLQHCAACETEPEDARSICEAMQRVLQGETDYFESDYSVLTPETIWFVVRIAPWQTEYGRGVTLIYSNITARRQAQAAHLESQWEFLEAQRRDREMTALERLSNAPQTRISAYFYGKGSLQEVLPDHGKELVGMYQKVLEQALEQRAYRITYDLSEPLRVIAERLGFLKAGPRDVVEIHSNAMRQCIVGRTQAQAQALLEEGRILLIELMGNLISYYRNYSTGRRARSHLEPKREDKGTE
jgi:hypothetical protein